MSLILITFLFIVIGWSHCVAQDRTPEEFALYLDSCITTEKYNREVYEILNNTFGWYSIGYIEPKDYSIFQDESYHNYLLLDYDGKIEPKYDNIFDRADLCIEMCQVTELWEVMYMSYHELYQIEKLIPNGFTDNLEDAYIIKVKNMKNGLRQVAYSVPPDGFLLFLMTGKACNNVSNTWLEQIHSDPNTEKPINFPDENAYYRVLMPLWRKAR